MAVVGFAGVAVLVLDFTGENLVLTGGAVAHAATEGEVESVGFCQFQDVILGGGPLQFHVGEFKNDFCHWSKKVTS